MTPGLAFFYAGMVRTRHALAMLMQNFVCLAVVSVTWTVCGYSLAFGTDALAGLAGDLHLAGLEHAADGVPGYSLTVPPFAFMAFQLMFAIITVALLSGAVADRMRFGAFVTFTAVWSVVVYAPLAHWSFAPSGWLARLGLLDFAGGTVVEICSGASALALVLVLGRRRGWPGEAMPPHNLPLTMLGAGLLWFGWLLLEKRTVGRATTLGGASGAVAGLVAITPAAGYVQPLPALLLGALAGAACLFAVRLKFRLRYDDALDVVGVHFVGGVVGTLFVGLFASHAVNAAVRHQGLLLGGGAGQLGRQAVGVGVATAWAFGMSWLIAKALDRVIGLRVGEQDEVIGLDFSQHAETAYELGAGVGSVRRGS